ncbi:glycosyltransferase family 2 protein [Sphingomonas oligophenolica]|uniref:Glycosyltransferase family 2 protein n=1 Tax=Sphingomonas oligophenolica TaxID=301154 RepID=A0ABU9YD18_9SPHN
MDKAILRIAVLLVCRNRRSQTVAAIRAVMQSRAPVELCIVLFDDASTDGTVEAVLAEFPATDIVRGDGNAFWNGGLHLAWKRALSLKVDGYLWLNDDVVIDEDALDRLAKAWITMCSAHRDGRFVLVGTTRNPDGSRSYGGIADDRTPLAFHFRPVLPAESLQRVDTFNGNFVFVTSETVATLGINDPHFHHNMGDLDYGLRATRAGIPVLLLPGFIGECAQNLTKARGYSSPSLSIREQWRKVNTHHGLPFSSWWHFTRRHSGFWLPFHFLLAYRWLVLPSRG